MNVVEQLNYPLPGYSGSGRIKQQPADFKVIEQLGFEPSGSGEHLLLYIQKTGLTTPQAIDQIADQLDIPARQFGYSGLKDKHAITRQWLSVQLPGYQGLPEIEQSDALRVLHSAWHDKKLRIGNHRSNLFEVRVRNVEVDWEDLQQRQSAIECHGFANYYGQQRFGVAQDNVQQALKSLNKRHQRKRLSRHKKSLYLSALRSELFNRILSARIGQGIWREPIRGDVFILSGSQSFFSATLDDALTKRYQALDIHCGISLYGTGETHLTDMAAVLEASVLANYPEMTETLLASHLKRAYRANRAQARHLEIQYDADNAWLDIKVELGKGVYLTTLLNHLVEIQG